MDYNKLFGPVDEWAKSAESERSRIQQSGRTQDQYIRAWGHLEKAFHNWHETTDFQPVVASLERLVEAAKRHRGDDCLTKVAGFSPADYDAEPACRTQARYVFAILNLLLVEDPTKDLDLLEQRSENQYLPFHVGSVRTLIESGKPTAICECGRQLWVDRFKAGICDDCQHKQAAEKARAKLEPELIAFRNELGRAEPNSKKTSGGNNSGRRQTANQLMMAEFAKNPNSAELSAGGWAKLIRKGKTTIQDTEAWELFKPSRDRRDAEKALKSTDRRRK